MDKNFVKKYFPTRHEDSHKGDNGRVCIIGGSVDYYGAPIFSGLGAVYSGADLVYIFVPESNFDCSRSFYPDFIIRKFEGDYLSEKNLDKIVELANTCHCVLIGPGISANETALKSARKLIPKIKVSCIIDADALKIVNMIKLPYQTLLTPHQGEFEKLIGHDFPGDLTDRINLIKKASENFGCQILVKGAVDIISKPDGQYIINKTGNAGMTVGGSGDLLAGMIAGVSAQGATLFEAASIATFCLGVSADHLFAQKGYAYSATDIALEIPYAIQRVIG